MSGKPTTFTSPKYRGVATGGGLMLNWSLSGPENARLGSSAEFKLTCKQDRQCVEIDIATLEAKMWVTGNQAGTEFEGSIRRQNRGVFIIQFKPTTSGPHNFNFWTKSGSTKTHIFDHNAVLNVIEEKPAEDSQMFFSLAGKGLLGAEVGTPASFNILVTGSGKVPVDVDMDKLVVIIESRAGGSSKAYPEKISSGKYKTNFTAGSAGLNTVRIVYDGQDVCSQNVTFDTGVDPRYCVVVNAPRNVDVGAQASFVIDSKSGLGLKLARGGEKFDVGVDGPDNGVQGLVVRDECTGSYTVRFRLMSPGKYKFFCTLRKTPISGSPFEVVAS